MLVCHCNCVNDRTIREVVKAGAKTADCVRTACRAGSCCGGCKPVIEQLIKEAKREHDR